MTATSPLQKEVHHGRNIKRLREILGVKQDELAIDLGLSQQAVSQLEQKPVVEGPMLEKVAQALKVSPEAIKNFDEEKAINFISNTTFENCQQPAVINYHPTFNPIDKWMEAMEEIKKLVDQNTKLYERLLQSEREKVELLSKNKS